MNMPGLTAQASLYATDGQYHLTCSDGISTAAVSPQARPIDPCRRLCQVCARTRLEPACAACDVCTSFGEIP